MTFDDESRLLARLTQTAELFSKTLTRTALQGYVRALSDLPLASLEHALRRCERECRYFPSPADIRSRLGDDGTKSGRGTYPPDIAARRRALHLPVTPEEHVAYDRGEYDEPRGTRAQMVATLRGTAARDRAGDFSPHGETGRVAWMDALADDIERRAADPATPRSGSPFAAAFRTIVARVLERDPGEEG